MKHLKIFLIALALAVGTPALAETAAVSADPERMIEQTSTTLLTALRERRHEFKANPDALRAMVDEVILPTFDISYAGRIVLGKHGRDASREQRQRFVDAFYRSLLRSYADGMVTFVAEEVRMLGSRPSGNDKLRVRTEVVLDNSTRTPIDYSLRKTDKGWMVYDVTVEGISYLSNFRKMVDSRIRDIGLDGLIAELEAGKLPENELAEGGAEEDAEG